MGYIGFLVFITVFYAAIMLFTCAVEIKKKICVSRPDGCPVDRVSPLSRFANGLSTAYAGADPVLRYAYAAGT